MHQLKKKKLVKTIRYMVIEKKGRRTLKLVKQPLGMYIDKEIINPRNSATTNNFELLFSFAAKYKGTNTFFEDHTVHKAVEQARPGVRMLDDRTNGTTEEFNLP